MMIVCTSWSWWEGGDPLEALLVHTARTQTGAKIFCSERTLHHHCSPVCHHADHWALRSPTFQHRITDLLSLQETLSARLHSWTQQKRRRSWNIDHCGQVRLHKDITWWSKCMWTHSCIMHVQQSVQSSVNRGEMSTNCAAGRVTQWPSCWDRLTTTLFLLPVWFTFAVLFFSTSTLHQVELLIDSSSSDVSESTVLHFYAVWFLFKFGCNPIKW